MNKTIGALCAALTLATALHALADGTNAPSPVGTIAIPATKLTTAPGSQAEQPKPKLLDAGVTPPDFVARNLEGKEIRLSDFKGKVLVLDFWATWCGPCLNSLPHTQKVAKEAKAQNVVVFAVCTSDTRANFEKWTKTEQAKFPNIVFACDPHERGSQEFGKRASAVYGVSGIPTQFVIGPDGKIVGSTVGFSPEGTGLEKLLAQAGVKLPNTTE